MTDNSNPAPPAARPRRSPSKRLEKAANWSSIMQGICAFLALIGSIVAIDWTIKVARQGVETWRQERTMEFHSQWSSAEMSLARQNILDAMTCRVREMGLAKAVDQSPSDPYGDVAYMPGPYRRRATAPASDGFRGLEPEMGRMLDFYGGINSCPDTVCDKELACVMFRDEASDYNNLFRPLLIEQRALFGPGYGRDFETFVNTCEADATPDWTTDDVTAKRRSELIEDMARPPNGIVRGAFENRIRSSCERMGMDMGE